MPAKPPLMDGLVINVHRGLGQEAFEAIRDTKLYRRGLAVFGTAGTPEVQSCTLCLEPSHLRNHRWHWDARDAHRPHHRVVNIHKEHLLGHRCSTLALSDMQPAPRCGILRLRVRAEQSVKQHAHLHAHIDRVSTAPQLQPSRSQLRRSKQPKYPKIPSLKPSPDSLAERRSSRRP